MQRSVVPLALGLLLAFQTAALPHGGGLNSDGCHNNRKTGGYHCHRGSSSRPTPTIRNENTGPLKCENKTRCGQMRSCEEARFYLNSCGLHRLDADSDGIPCESICGGNQ